MFVGGVSVGVGAGVGDGIAVGVCTLGDVCLVGTLPPVALAALPADAAVGTTFA